MAEDCAIAFNGLRYAYLARRRAVRTDVLRDYTGAVRRRSVFAVLGPNGRGKTTLLKLLLGTPRPDKGIVTIGVARPSSA